MTSWSWTFGDGIGSSTLQNPSYTYNDTGLYSVTLSVTGPGGTDDTTRVDLIHVTEPPPVANFSASPDSGDRPLLVQFTDQSTGGGVTSWSWTFGDGGTSFAQNPTHQYTTTGLFDVSLSVTGPGGSDDTTMVQRIHVTEPLTANFFAFPLSGLPGDTIQFIDQSTGEPGEPSSWSWNFGDLGSSNQQNPKHVYNNAGTYSVTLTVTGNGGRTDDTTRVDYIVISENPPVAGFSGTPRSGVAPLGVQFTDLSSGSIDTWSWAFGDGGTSHSQDPLYTYTTPGVYDVSLTVTGPGGQDTDSIPNYITVYDSLHANFTANPRSGLRPLSVQFTDLSTPSGEIDTWKWYFGDGDSSMVQHPQHTYQDSGWFDVTLVITGPAGADTLKQNNYIRVNEPAPVADFSGFPTSGQAPLDVTFSDLSTGAITSWQWDFGDGGSSFTQNPTHEYTRADQFTVSLTVTGPGGSDTDTKTNYITVTPGDPDTILVYDINDPITAGVPSNVTVEVRDGFGNRATQYAGTVHFSSDDPGNETLPSDYMFVPGTDQGIHNFTNGVTLVTVGEREVGVNEVGNPSLWGKQSSITVQPNNPASVIITPGDTVNVTVGASRVFTAEVTDAWNNTIQGQRIDIFLKGTIYGSLSENTADPNPTFGSSTSRYGDSDSNGRITVLYTAPSDADRYDVLDAQAQPYVPSSQVDDVVIHSDAGGATKLVILPTDAIETTANTPFDITIEAWDDFDNRDPSNNSTALLSSSSPTMEFSIDGFQSTITQITLNGGTTLNLQARDPTTGNPSITAADQGGLLAQDTKTNITIDPGPADHFTLSGIPGSITAGDPQTVSVEVLDAWDNRKTDYTGTVTFSTNDPGSQVSLPADYPFQLADAGFHTFTDGVTLVTAGDWYVIARDASNSSVFGIISGINVTPAAADSLDISGIPDTVEAGSPTPFTVTVLDPYLNVVTGYQNRVTFSTDDPGSEVVLPPDYDFDPLSDQGIHHFDNPGMVLVTAGTRMIEAEEVGNPSVHGTHAGITVTNTAVDTLILSGIPSNVEVGTYHSLSVEAVDRYTNRVLNYTGTVKFTSSDDSATLPDPYTFLAGDQGFHTFSNSVLFRTAGLNTVSATDSVNSAAGRSSVIDVSPGDAATLIITPTDTVPVTVNSYVIFTSTVRDSFNNLLSGESVTFVLHTPNNGVLSDNPDNSNNTTGVDVLQQGTTDSTGTLTVQYRAPSEAGLTDILDAYSSIDSSEVDNVTIITVASGATRLVILPEDSIQSTANVPFSLTIEAQDNNSNRDMNDSTKVSLTSDSETMEFSTDGFQSTISKIQLANGQSQGLQARDHTSGRPSITAQDSDSTGIRLTPDTKSDITILPSSPFGTIELSFTGRDTLSADGSSVTSMTSSGIRDMYGNIVESGTEVTLSATIGAITSTDVDPGIAGIQVRTDSLGIMQIEYRAGTVAGPDTVTAASVTGNASGTIIVILQSPPDLAYSEESLNPNTVSPGTVQAFELVLANNGGAGVTIQDSTSFYFGIGQVQYRSMLSGSYFIGGGGGTDTLHFQPDSIPEQMPEGVYTPSLNIYGLDTNGAPFHHGVTVLDDNLLHVSSLILNSVVVFADTVSYGDSVEVELEVKNSGGAQIVLGNAGLFFSPSGGQFSDAFRGLPMDIPPNGTKIVNGSVRVGSLTPPGTYIIDAYVSGTSQGGVVSDSSANNKDSWVVESAALASYVDGSLQPGIVSGTGTYDFHVDLINYGDAEVTLNQATTHLLIGEGGALGDVSIPEKKVMPGDSAVSTLTFDTVTIPGAAEPGRYPLTLFLDGTTGHGGVFQQVLSLSDSVTLEAPPEISYLPNTLSNRNVSSGYPHFFTLRLANGGGSSLDLDPNGSIFYFSGSDTSYSSQLFGQGVSTINPGTDTTLTFSPAVVPGSLASGSYPGFAVLSGNFNGVSYLDTLSVDSIYVERPATLRVDLLSAPEKVSQGETFSVSAMLTNEGEAGVISSGSVTLSAEGLGVQNPTLSFGPALPDTASWQVSVPSGMSPGIVELSVSISEAPLDENSGLSAFLAQETDNFALSVVERNRLSLERMDITDIPPQNVFKGQKGVPMLYLLSRSMGEKEGDIRLDDIVIRVEERGGITVLNPENVLDRIYLGGSGGDSVIAEATSPVQGEYTLSPANEYRIGSDPDTLRFFVDVSPKANVVTFQLMINGAEAVDAVDLSTGLPANIVEGNSEDPLGALRSNFTVLNQQDFAGSFKNYPNPMGSGDGSTTFAYYLQEESNVTIMIYTLTGSLVKKFHFPAGQTGGRGPSINQVRWDGLNGRGRYVNNGVYICIATARTRSGKTYTTRHKLAVMR